jgi:hypothetical protein
MKKRLKIDKLKTVYLKDEGDYVSIKQRDIGEIGFISKDEVDILKKELINKDIKIDPMSEY